MNDSALPSSTPDANTRGGFSPRLIGVNIALLGLLALVTFVASGAASGQSGQPLGGRGRGEYAIVSGRAQGVSSSTIYILDASNQELVGLVWNRNSNQADIIGYRSLLDDQKFLQRPR